jgi:hypothetical protein
MSGYGYDLLLDDLKISRMLCERVTKKDICLSTGSAV